MDAQLQQKYIQVLKEELIPAEGCTEPIALALCAAKAREALGEEPERFVVWASGNIIKNVKSVVVPGTGGKKGIPAAVIYGAIAGHPDRELEVLQDLAPAAAERAAKLCDGDDCVEVRYLKTPAKLHIIVELYHGEHSALAEIRDTHTNVIRIEKNGEVLYRRDCRAAESADPTDERDRFMTLRDILDFAASVPLGEVQAIIDRQIEYNTRIAEEGLAGDYGASVGRTIMEVYGADIKSRCIAKAAAGSDARMSGAELPVVINSGSGNQGMTASLPVIEYAREIGADEERLVRALLVSNLVAVYQKAGMGRLSAYCGAVCAATGSVVGIAWLDNASYEVIENTIKNALGVVSGIVCDGAKPSCAAKIAMSIQAAFMGYEMAVSSRAFCGGDGIVKSSADETVEAVGDMARNGMVQTDEEIIRIMLEPEKNGESGCAKAAG